MHTIWVTLTMTLTSDLISRFFISGAAEYISFITNNLPQMSHMQDQFLWGHSSRYCDISCKLRKNISQSKYSINREN